MNESVNLRSLRARKARLAKRIGDKGYKLLIGLVGVGLLAGAYFVYLDGALARPGFAALAFACGSLLLALWYRFGLKDMPPEPQAQSLEGIIEPGLLASLKAPLTPRSAWEAACKNPEALFITNHLLLDWKSVLPHLSDDEKDMSAVWHETMALVAAAKPYELHAGVLAAAIMIKSSVAQSFLTSQKMHIEELGEILNWLERQLQYFRTPQPYFGGIGRDWATGYTPTLEHFSTNLSRQIERDGGGAHYAAHSELLEGVVSSLSRGNGVALVGADGTGKTTLVYGLAQRLLEGKDKELKYYQIVSLNAAQILSYSGAQLEKLMLTLFGEAIGAGNIILFLDDAQLFFSNGVGAFDMSQVLLPVLKNRNLKIVAAFSPNFWQQLQAHQSTLTSSFTTITVNEPSQQATYKIVEDLALVFEHRYKTLVSYEAIREAYRLSGQYIQEQSYPAKAVSLLEQAMPYAQDHALSAQSIQTAIERTRGVKVSAAAEPEADMLLHLEDRIHERMINQKRAVTVVASALRRGRAGVANPKRPVGSFLFLGPTGVGKTELARSLAAVYFGDEHQLIRLDMSEYQRPEDAYRLLDTSGQTTAGKSLLLGIREQPFSVVLLDEVEKAHPNVLNLLLQMLDEGQLTDSQGRQASFRSAIIIATSNAGAADIAGRVREGGTLDDFERPLIDKLIGNGQFKPELINRFDEVVLFRPLNEDELGQVAQVMLAEVNKTLDAQQIAVSLTPQALQEIVHRGYDPEFGARPMRRVIQKTVEDTIATKILRQEIHPGDHVVLDVGDLGTV